MEYNIKQTTAPYRPTVPCSAHAVSKNKNTGPGRLCSSSGRTHPTPQQPPSFYKTPPFPCRRRTRNRLSQTCRVLGHFFTLTTRTLYTSFYIRTPPRRHVFLCSLFSSRRLRFFHRRGHRLEIVRPEEKNKPYDVQVTCKVRNIVNFAMCTKSSLYESLNVK